MRRELGRLQGIEPAPGPRGGEGWRVAPAVVEQLAREREGAAAARMERNAPQRAAAAALSSRFAAVTLDEAAQQVRAAYPDLELVPRRKWGRLCPFSVGMVVSEWSRTHRYGGIMVHGDSGVITCEWQHAGKLARVLDQLDAVVAHRIEAAAKHHQTQLAALTPYRDGAVTPGK